MQDLVVSLIQTVQHWEDKVKNLTHFEQLIQETPSSDLIVLPEMFNTGFSMNASNLAEDMNGEGVSWLHRMASTQKSAIAGSLIIEENSKYYNRFVLVKPDGSTQHYNKRHLFTMAGEHNTFAPGNERVIWELNGWKICPQVCYDLRFPVWSRNHNTYDLLLYPANWPKKRISHWRSLSIARAIENQCYLACVNRVGLDGNGIEYNGCSAIINYDGNTIREKVDDEAILTATLSMVDLIDRRKSFPVMDDADGFNLL